MKHTSAGRHATRRNDDLGVRARADRLRLLDLARIGSDIARSAADLGRQPMIGEVFAQHVGRIDGHRTVQVDRDVLQAPSLPQRSEEHTSELQSLMRISYAVFCLKKKITHRYMSIFNNILYN